jgi:glycosyltransferase involved in cell wall biosynthesis
MFDLPNLNAASGIHYSTDAERDNAAFLGLSAPTFVVPNGLDWNRFRVLPARGGFRQKWVPENASVMLFVGRIHPVKGLDTLILAFAEIYAKHPNARLVIVGPENDDYGNHLRSRIREIGLDAAIVFTGPLIGVELVQAYVDADIFVLPSHTENFGMVVAEAMASAMPVVISDQVKVSADVANAGAGIVTRRNVADLAEALEGLLSNESKRSAMGNAGRRLVHEKYRLPEVLRAFFLEYAKAIDGNSNRAKP